MYIKYIYLYKKFYINLNVGTINYMAEPTVQSPHVIHMFPHTMANRLKVMIDGDSGEN